MIVKKNKEELLSYLKDASNIEGSADILYIPENKEELKECLAECSRKKIPVTLSGAGTGLTAGRTPYGGAVISTEKLKKILINKSRKTALVQPGVFVSELQEKAGENGLFYPPNPTEINSSLGGNAATNASGSRTLKYGSTRDFILSAEVILMSGESLFLQRGRDKANGRELILKSEKNEYKIEYPDIHIPELKHAAGYFLKPDMDALDLFIGSEGTLGVFSEMELKLIEKPENLMSGFVFFQDENRLLDFAAQAGNGLKSNFHLHYIDINDTAPRVLEYFDRNSLNFIQKSNPGIPADACGAIWFEQEYASEYEEELLEKWSVLIYKNTPLADDTWLALGAEKNREKIRELRHSLPLAVNERLVLKNLKKIGTDTAVPDENFRSYFFFLHNEIKRTGLDYYIFGHIGNCHVHANVFAGTEDEIALGKKFYKKSIDKALEMNGTISAEHGIGKIKKEYLRQMYSGGVIEKMSGIKRGLDPDFLLGRGNLF